MEARHDGAKFERKALERERIFLGAVSTSLIAPTLKHHRTLPPKRHKRPLPRLAPINSHAAAETRCCWKLDAHHRPSLFSLSGYGVCKYSRIYREWIRHMQPDCTCQHKSDKPNIGMGTVSINRHETIIAAIAEKTNLSSVLV